MSGVELAILLLGIGEIFLCASLLALARAVWLGMKRTTTVEKAARGIKAVYVDGHLVASDADVERISRAITEHRAGLMRRLGR